MIRRLGCRIMSRGSGIETLNLGVVLVLGQRVQRGVFGRVVFSSIDLVIFHYVSHVVIVFF
jgi:hypothetical protein